MRCDVTCTVAAAANAATISRHQIGLAYIYLRAAHLDAAPDVSVYRVSAHIICFHLRQHKLTIYMVATGK